MKEENVEKIKKARNLLVDVLSDEPRERIVKANKNLRTILRDINEG